MRKVAIAPKCLEEEGFQYKNIARNHGNIDIILILEKPSITLLPSNHRKGKRARAFFRWIWGIFQELNSLPSSRKCDTVAKKIGSFWICNFACKNASTSWRKEFYPPCDVMDVFGVRKVQKFRDGPLDVWVEGWAKTKKWIRVWKKYCGGSCGINLMRNGQTSCYRLMPLSKS